MDALLESQHEMELIIDGYTRANLPSDIRQKIHNNFIQFHWKCKVLFDFDHNEFGYVLESCIQRIYQDPKHDIVNKPILLDYVKKQQINGRIFCSFSKKDWMLLLKKSNVCSMGVAIKLRKQIYRFDLNKISIGSPVYLPIDIERQE